MPKPFYAEQTVVVDGETLCLAINFHAIDATEKILDRGYDELLEEIQQPHAKIGVTAPVLWGLLREHHRELTLDHATSLLFGETGVTIGLAVHQLLTSAFPTAEKEKGKNPPKRRGVSKLS